MIDDSDLLHADRVYDPIKAREYYLRTRQLKGRSPAKAVTTGTISRDSSSSGREIAAAPQPRVSPAQRRRQRQAIKARAEALQVKLDRLNEVLQKLVDQAKARSGADVEEKKSPSQKQAEAKEAATKEKPATATEKKEAAERAKKSYEENKEETPNAEVKRLESEVAAVEQQIRQARANISEAVSKAKKEITARRAELSGGRLSSSAEPAKTISSTSSTARKGR